MRANKELTKVYRVLNEARKHVIPNSSSGEMVEKLLSGKYDSKLRLVTSTNNINNYIEATKLSDKVWNLGVIVDTNKYKKAPTDQVKRIDWIFDNMDSLNIYIEL